MNKFASQVCLCLAIGAVVWLLLSAGALVVLAMLVT
jgi:hypothetical protein